MEKKIKQYAIAEALFALITVAWAMFLLSLLLSGCMTPNKAVGYLKKKHLLADTCAANYPVLADTVYKDGEVVVDVVYLPGDTVRAVDTVAKVERVTVTSPTRVITRHKVDTLLLVKVDSAKVAAGMAEIRRIQAAKIESDTNTAKWKEKAANRLKWAWMATLAAAVLLVVIGWMLKKSKA